MRGDQCASWRFSRSRPTVLRVATRERVVRFRNLLSRTRGIFISKPIPLGLLVCLQKLLAQICDQCPAITNLPHPGTVFTVPTPSYVCRRWFRTIITLGSTMFLALNNYVWLQDIFIKVKVSLYSWCKTMGQYSPKMYLSFSLQFTFQPNGNTYATAFK